MIYFVAFYYEEEAIQFEQILSLQGYVFSTAILTTYLFQDFLYDFLFSLAYLAISLI